MGLRDLDAAAPGLQRRGRRRSACETRDPAEALDAAARARPAARVPRGRTGPGRRLRARRPRRRGRRLRRARAAGRGRRAPWATSASPRSTRHCACGSPTCTVGTGRGHRASERHTCRLETLAEPLRDHPEKRTDMFTGIVEELGTVEALEDQGDAVRLTVRGPLVTSDAGLGRLDLRQRLLPHGDHPTARTGDAVHRRRDARDARQDLARCARARCAGQPRARGHPDHPARRPHRAGPCRRHGHGGAAYAQRALGARRDRAARPTSSATSCRRARSPSTASP